MESKIFVSEQKNDVLKKLKKIFLIIHLKKFILVKIIIIKKILKVSFIKIN